MTFPQPTLQQSNALAALLSLDLLRPFWRDLQLHAVAAEPADLVAALRRLVLAARARYETDSSSTPDVLQELVTNLDASGQQQAATMLLSWSRLAYLGSHSDQPQLSGWEIVLVQCAFAGAPEMARDEGGCIGRWASSYRDKLSTLDLRTRIETLRREPLSEWDFEMFARHGYGAESFNDPWDRIESMINVITVFLCWHELSETCSAAQRARVVEIGNDILARLGVWMPAPLVLPEPI